MIWQTLLPVHDNEAFENTQPIAYTAMINPGRADARKNDSRNDSLLPGIEGAVNLLENLAGHKGRV